MLTPSAHTYLSSALCKAWKRQEFIIETLPHCSWNPRLSRVSTVAALCTACCEPYLTHYGPGISKAPWHAACLGACLVTQEVLHTIRTDAELIEACRQGHQDSWS